MPCAKVAFEIVMIFAPFYINYLKLENKTWTIIIKNHIFIQYQT